MPTERYRLETRDPIFKGVAQYARIDNSWSRGMLKKVFLTPSRLSVILIHPYIAKDERAFEGAWAYKEKYNAQTVIVGELREDKEDKKG